MSDEAICGHIGERVKKLRLDANLSQGFVTEETGISRQTLINLETHGKGTLATLVAVLRAIGALDRLSSLTEEIRPSPIKVMQLGGKMRQRASTSSPNAPAQRVLAGKSRVVSPQAVKKKTKEGDW
ncbi:helix-turn-helix transcriptional regulator [Pseudomonas aeruginosa]